MAADSVSVYGNIEKFIKNWKSYVNENQVDFSDKNVKRKRLNIWKPLFQAFGWKFLLSSLIFLINNVSLYANPLALKLLINHIDPKEDEESWKGYLYAFCLFSVSVFGTLTYTHGVVNMLETAICVRTALISAICRHELNPKTLNILSLNEISVSISKLIRCKHCCFNK